MDKKFDYSEFELGKLTYSFAELTPAEADEKRTLYEQFVREKEEAKAAQAAAKAKVMPAKPDEQTPIPAVKVGRPSGPVFRPTAKPVTETKTSESSVADAPEGNAAPTPESAPQPKKPVFRPTQKPPRDAEPADRPDAAQPIEARSKSDDPVTVQGVPAETPAADLGANQPEKPKARPAFRPSMKPAGAVANSEDKEARKPVTEQNSAGSALAHPLTDATPDEMERIAEDGRESVGLPDGPLVPESTPAPELNSTARSGATPAAFRPTMKPAKPVVAASNPAPSDSPEPATSEPPKPKPAPAAFRPTMKPTRDGGPTQRTKPEPGDAE